MTSTSGPVFVCDNGWVNLAIWPGSLLRMREITDCARWFNLDDVELAVVCFSSCMGATYSAFSVAGLVISSLSRLTRSSSRDEAVDLLCWEAPLMGSNGGIVHVVDGSRLVYLYDLGNGDSRGMIPIEVLTGNIDGGKL